MKIRLTTKCAVAALLLTACNGPSASDADGGQGKTPADRLIAELGELREKGTMLGHQDDLAYGSMWYGIRDASDVKAVCGDYPAVFGWDISGIETGAALSSDSVKFSDIGAFVRKADAMGGISAIRWSPAGDAAALDDEEMSRIAAFLSGLNDDSGEAIPVIFLPLADASATEGTATEEFVGAWKKLHAYLSDKGADNIVFAYSAGNPSTLDDIARLYPGDDYTDIVGGELLYDDAADYRKYRQELSRIATLLEKFTGTRQKIPAITATGMEGVKTPVFFSAAVTPAIKGKGLSYIMFWKNSFRDENYYHVPVKGHPTADDFERFVESRTILTLSDLSKK